MSWHTKRPVRVAIVVVLLLSVVLAVASLGLYRARSLRLAMKQWRQQGIVAVDDGRFQDATPLLERYLTRNPDDVAVLYALAVANASQPELGARGRGRAELLLRQVLRHDAEHLSAAQLLLELQSLDRDAQAVLAAADAVLRIEPGDMVALSARARALAATQKPGEALALIEALLARRPLDFEAHLLKLELLDRLGRSADELRAHGSQTLDAMPDEPLAHAVMAVASAAVGDGELALLQARAAAEGEPVDPYVLRHVADLLDRFGDAQASGDMLQRAVDAQQPASPQVLVALGRRLWQRQQWEQLVALEARLQQVPAILPAERRALLEAKSLISWAATEVGQAERAVELRDQLAVEPGSVAKAWGMVLDQKQDPLGVDRQALYDALRVALNAESESPPLLLMAGDVAASLGLTRDAVAHWRQAAERAPAWSTPLVRATRLLAGEGRSAEALSAIRMAMRRRPDDMEAVAAAAEAWWSALSWQPGASDRQLLEFVEQLRQDAPDLERVWIVHIALLLRIEGRAPAQAALDQIIARQKPMSDRTALQLAELARRAGMTGGAALLRQQLALSSPTPAMVFGLLGLTRATPQAGLEMIDELDDGRVEWQLVRAASLERMGESQQALVHWRELVRQHASDPRVIQAALQSPVVIKERHWTRELIEQLRQLTGETGLAWREARATWLLQSQGQEQAAEAAGLLTQLVTVDPHNADLRLMFADALLRLGDPQRAEVQLAEATQLRPRSIPVLLSRAAVAIERKDVDLARAALDRVLRIGDLNEDQRRQTANLLAAVGWRERAQVLLSAGDSDEVLLASLQLQAGDVEAAWGTIARVLEDEPSPMVLLLASRLALLRQDEARADAMLNQLESRGVSPFEAASLRAQLYADLSMNNEAQMWFARAMAMAGDDAQKVAVHQPWLAMLVRRGVVAEVAQLLEQKGATASMVAAGVSKEQLLQAVVDPHAARLAAAALTRGDDAAPLWDAMRLLLAAGEDSSRRDAVAARLQRLVTANASDHELAMVAVRYALSVGRPAEASQMAADAVVRFPRSREATALETASLMQQERWSLVPGAAQRWRARLNPGQTYEPDLAEAAAEASLGRTPQAIAMARPHAEAGRDEAVLMMAKLMLTQQQPEEAFAWIEPRLSEELLWRAQWRLIVRSLPDAPHAADRLATLDFWFDAADAAERTEHAVTWAAVAHRTGEAAHASKATSLLEKTLTHAELNALALHRIGRSFEQLGNPVRAREVYRLGLAVEAANPALLNDLAMLLLNSGESQDLAEALALAERAVESSTAGPWTWDTLSLARSRAGDTVGAVEAASRAAQLAPEQPQWLITLAERQLAADQHADAAATLASLQVRFRSLDASLQLRVDALRATLKDAPTR